MKIINNVEGQRTYIYTKYISSTNKLMQINTKNIINNRLDICNEFNSFYNVGRSVESSKKSKSIFVERWKKFNENCNLLIFFILFSHY